MRRWIRNLSSTRNVGIIAHIDAGKTTTTEAMLFHSNYTSRIGSVDAGTTVTDHLPAERQRGITIQSACIPIGHAGARINIADTPGHIDFSIEVTRCVRVLDGLVLLLDAGAGVQAQTSAVWAEANAHELPRIIFCNKMDSAAADWKACLRSISTRLQGWGVPVPIQWPLRAGGIMDLVELKVVDSSGETEQALSDIPNECFEARNSLVEAVSDADDELLEHLLGLDMDASRVSPCVLRLALRRSCIQGKCMPVLMGASFRDIGVKALMDAVVLYLPSPTDRPPTTAFPLTPSPKTGKMLLSRETEKVAVSDPRMFALAFKVIHDKNRGPLVFVRVYSVNTTQDCAKERATKLLQMYADDYEEIPCIEAGNIACIQGLKFTRTGDTLMTFAAGSTKKTSRPAQLLPITIPPPVFFCSIEPASRSEEKRFDEGIALLLREDPSLSISVDDDTRQTLLGGLGELHLEIAVSQLREVHRVNVDVGPVVIGYRETLLDDAPRDHQETFVLDRDVLGKRSWASVTVSISRIRDTENLVDLGDEIRESADGGNLVECDATLLEERIPSGMNLDEVERGISRGVSNALSRGPFLGFPVTNMHVKLIGLECRSEVSSVSAISVAAFRATTNGISAASKREPGVNSFGLHGTLLEPIMKVDIRIPQRFVGVVTRDLGGVRRAQILSLDDKEDDEEVDDKEYKNQVVCARIPLSSLMGYSTSLRGLTQGTGSFTMALSGFGVVNQDKIEEISLGK